MFGTGTDRAPEALLASLQPHNGFIGSTPWVPASQLLEEFRVSRLEERVEWAEGGA